MKTSKLKILANPFEKIAGYQALIVGLIFVVVIGCIGALSGVYFNGAIDIHLFEKGNYLNAFIYLLNSIISIVFVFCLFGIIFSKKFRLIDILGTVTLSKAPFIIAAFMGFFVNQQKITEMYSNPQLLLDFNFSGTMIVFSLICIPIIIWNIILLYNAYKVSLNIKGIKNIVTFIIAIILSEIVSIALNYLLVCDKQGFLL